MFHGARHSAESFFHTSFGCHKKTVGGGEKLLTYLNSALKALLGFDIFPRVPKKKSEILLPSVIIIMSSGIKLNLTKSVGRHRVGGTATHYGDGRSPGIESRW